MCLLDCMNYIIHNRRYAEIALFVPKKLPYSYIVININKKEMQVFLITPN